MEENAELSGEPEGASSLLLPSTDGGDTDTGLPQIKSHLRNLGISDELAFAETDGMTLFLLNKLVEVEFGGLETLRGLTINEVRDKLIVPARAIAGGSYIDYLKARPEFATEVRRATVFTSYNLGCTFLDFLDAINSAYSASKASSSSDASS
jgi:hypothetical protein